MPEFMAAVWKDITPTGVDDSALHGSPDEVALSAQA
jgi:hypothetical protein